MAYNSYIPNYPYVGFQAPQQPQIPPQPQYRPQQQQPVANGIIWVQGLAGAKSYLLAPGQTAMLMDSENPVFYIKSADQSGMPTLRAFDYKERATEQAAPAPAQPGVDMRKYVTWEELEKKFPGLLKGGAGNEQSAV
jgi:hypothetical protein